MQGLPLCASFPFFHKLFILQPVCLRHALSKEECLTRQLGRNRVSATAPTGAPAITLQKPCEGLFENGDVRPVQSLWEKGRQRGLPAYCVPAKAFSEGKKGNKLRPVCPASQMSALQAANSNGLEFHELTDDIEQAQYKIDEIDRRVVAEDSSEARAFLLHRKQNTIAVDSFVGTETFFDSSAPRNALP